MIGLQDSYQDWLALFNVHMYDEFHALDVLIVFAVYVTKLSRVLIQTKAILQIIDA